MSVPKAVLLVAQMITDFWGKPELGTQGIIMGMSEMSRASQRGIQD